MDEKDRELLKRIQNGDKKAEEELLSKYSERILVFFRHHIGYYNVECKDLRQDTMLAFLENLKNSKVDPDKGISLSSYIYGIASNKLKDYFKERKKHGKDIPPDDEFPGPDEPYNEFWALILPIIKKLKENHQRVLILEYYRGYTISEIASEMEITNLKVSELKHQAIKYLKKECNWEDFFQ